MPNPTAVMRIDVATVGTGTNDTSRNDGVPNQVVTLNWVGTGSPTTYLWRFWDYQGAQSVPSISNSTTATATFTPAGGASAYGQSFGIELVIDSGLGTEVSSRRILRIPTQRQGIFYPVFAEGADPKASRQNNGSTYIASSTDNSSSNYAGWTPRLYSFLKQYEATVGRIVVVPNPYTATGTTETWIGSTYLPVCTLNSIHAYLGCQVGTDTATLKLYRNSDASLVTTLTTTSAPQDVSVSTISISQEGWYELHMYGSQTSTVTLCRGVFFDIKC